MKGLGAVLLLLASGAAAVGWNVRTFLRAEYRERVATHLDFLPSPAVARTMALGQHGTLSKWRLISSYPYFIHQVTARDDRVAGGDGRGGFLRLYETLIALDPLFEEFYLKGATAVGGIMQDHHGELVLWRLGEHNLPRSSRIRMNLLSCLASAYDMERTQPEILASFLADWERMERAKDGNPRSPVDWAAAMQRRSHLGILQLAHWAEPLARAESSVPGGPESLVLQGNIRRYLAERHAVRLQELVDAWTARAGTPPATLAECVDHDLLTSLYPPGVDPFHASQPFKRLAPYVAVLRRDPYGHEWRLAEGRVRGIGLERLDYQQRLAEANAAYRQASQAAGGWARELGEALDRCGAARPAPPPDGALRLADGRIVVDWAAGPEHEPWSVGELCAAGGVVLHPVR